MAGQHERLPALEDLAGMSLDDLKRLYQRLFSIAPRIDHRRFLVRRVAWQLQAERYGGLSETALARLAELTEQLNPLAAMIAKGKQRRAAAKSDKLRAPTRQNSPAHGKRIPPRGRRLGRDARLPMPGSVLRRVYQGREILVRVLDGGFEFDGKTYRSLSAIAKQITGAHWNGMLFFGLIAQQKAGNKESA